MVIRFRRQAIKFIEKADPGTISRIQEKLNYLLICVESQSLIPFTELDIKQMKGYWEGFYRLRVGKVRLIFTINTEACDTEVYGIGNRGDVYKKG